jgi:hypothetical protein
LHRSPFIRPCPNRATPAFNGKDQPAGLHRKRLKDLSGGGATQNQVQSFSKRARISGALSFADWLFRANSGAPHKPPLPAAGSTMLVVKSRARVACGPRIA